MISSITLFGEDITGDWNTAALEDIAPVFGGNYIGFDDVEGECTVDFARFDCLIAAENVPGARDVFSFRPPDGAIAGLLMGNEAKGLRRRTLKRANAKVEIPLASLNINCLNVAAAAAVMLYYLSLKQRLQVRQSTASAIARNRPDLLLIGGDDPMELGSTVRSACAFGWEKVFLSDPKNAWYECDRRIKSEGRGAARRGRNPIKVIPKSDDLLGGYRKLIVCTSKISGKLPFQEVLPVRNHLIVMPDEGKSDGPWSPPDDWDGEVTYVVLPQVSSDRYHYRQMSAIALAEIARQLGRSESGIYLRSKKDRYRREVEGVESETALDLEDLMVF